MIETFLRFAAEHPWLATLYLTMGCATVVCTSSAFGPLVVSRRSYSHRTEHFHTHHEEQ